MESVISPAIYLEHTIVCVTYNSVCICCIQWITLGYVIAIVLKAHETKFE